MGRAYIYPEDPALFISSSHHNTTFHDNTIGSVLRRINNKMGRTQVLVSAVLALATLSVAVPLPGSRIGSFRRGALAHNTSSSITWGPCSDQFPSSLTCATYTVPLDWSNPCNETIELGLVRLAASDESARIGNLFVNPGGPGGQASSLVGGLARSPDILDPQILAHFDIIGLDPRGVGLSTPVQCDTAAFNKRVSFFPKTQAEYDELVAYNKALGESCYAKSGRLIDFVDTISAVKDHEAVRKALGDEKINLLGLSYGTQLFSQYAELFPDNIRTIVLDGNLQHSQSESSNLLIESATYEATLKKFFEWCTNSTSEECTLSGSDVQAKYQSVLDKAIAAPIPAPGCDNTSCRSDVTDEDLRFTIQGSLISTSNWPALAVALSQADAGNATLISQNNALAVGDAYADSTLLAGTAIACQDWDHASTSLADVVAKGTLGANFSPLTRGACQSYKIQTSCIGWPAPLSNPPKKIVYKGETTILQAQSTFDPSTSYAWGLGLHAELGDEKSVLLVRDGAGHTSYLRGGATTAAINEYFLNLTLPEPGTVLDS
ncbi:alpha/beta-hydrolase [Annulohypoxylon maeteangense]|uniref:alpha/beta-hydrolase n=1 Tax=Annulohypoxylon maeteangense TaxID=1927788 RepID=UPI0020078D4C|nr:alpha/beta-hydrolase [Annulohypoxylon maeteangense]KAI0883539.1 alpha/beta-hydrolase [Annulohypoxylon maeteangense]